MAQDLGPYIWNEGQQPIVDIVFVHGLRGHRVRTWQKDHGKITGQETIWPKDLLPKDVPEARIITWGYDADAVRFFNKTSQSSVMNHAKSLLTDLISKRRGPDKVERPIILVGHSLGGVIIKQAICISRDYEASGRNFKYANIARYTKGLVFLGTPHRGSDSAKWLSVANNFAKFLSNTAIVDQNERLRSSLERGSFVLDDLQDRFAGWIDRFPITTAVEDLEYGNIGKIVDQDTATLGVKNEDVIYIPANHSDMCKFGDSQDLGYQRISNAIIDQVDSIKQEIERKDHQQRQAAQTQSRGVDFAEELPIRSASGVAPSELPAETESAVQNQIETPIDSAQQKTENPVDAQELEEQAAQPEEMIVVEVGIQPSPISLDVYSRLVEDFIDQIKSPSEEFRQGFDRIKNFRKQKTGANEEEGSEQAEAQGKPPPYQAFLGNFHENSRLSQERALYLAALLGRKPMVYKFLQAGINPNSTPDFDFDEVQLTPLGAAIMMHEDDVLQLLLDGGADLRLYYYDPNDNAETADAGAEQLQGDPAPAEETAAKPDEAPAAEQEKSYSRSITCDACGDRIADLEDYYHCGTCRHGNFNICQSCVGNKFSCFGKSVGHTLSKRRVVNGEVQEGGGGELEQESEEVVPELDTSLELPLEALLVTACNGTANATGLILEYGHIQAIPDDLQVVQSTVLLGQAETLEVLIRHGASVDECDQDETTALHYACLKGYQAEAETLLRLGANPNKQDHGLRNALHYAVAGKNEELLKVLLGWESPAVDLEALDEDGDPALMYSATTVGSEKLTLLLLEKGASLKPVNKEGKSLSEQAQAVAGNEENVGMLAATKIQRSWKKHRFGLSRLLS